MRGEVGNKTPKKEIDNSTFLWGQMDDFLTKFWLGRERNFEVKYIVLSTNVPSLSENIYLKYRKLNKT